MNQMNTTGGRLLLLFLFFSLSTSAQTYQELSEKAISYVQKDSLLQAESLFKEAQIGRAHV